MEDTVGFQDWELLQTSDAALISTPYAAERSDVSDGIDDDSQGGAIKSDYFALDSENRHPRRAPSEEETEEGGIDSDNPSWLDPDSDSRYVDRTRGEMGFASMGFPGKNSGGFWSDESSDGQRSPADSEKGEPGDMGASITEVGYQGIEAGRLSYGGSAAGEDLGIGEVGGSEGVETGHQEHVEFPHAESAEMSDGSDSSAQISAGTESPSNLSAGEGEKRRLIWWKMPFELLKFCALRVRPIWSISIAAAFLGVFMLGRRLYKMRNKGRSIALKISIDDKKASQFMVRAARLNEAFSVVRPVPIIRPSLPAAAGGVTPWPVVSFR